MATLKETLSACKTIVDALAVQRGGLSYHPANMIELSNHIAVAIEEADHIASERTNTVSCPHCNRLIEVVLQFAPRA